MVVMLAPVAPHFAEECWERLGHEGSVLDTTWPTWDAGLLSLDRIEIVVQVNGKTRSRIEIDRAADEETVVATALADEAVRRHLDGKQVRKRIYVRERLLNLVVG
jgi:leucyl-tRNA synthetase